MENSQEKYYKRSLTILRDVINHNLNTLTKDQCLIISNCFLDISQQKEVNKETFDNIDDLLLDKGLDWTGKYTD